MKRFFDEVFVKTANNYNKKVVNQTVHINHKELQKRAFTMSGDLARKTAKTYQAEVKKATAFKVLKHAVQSVMPKNLGMTLLKMKIHMQTLIGNTFGIKFSGLEESKKRLKLMESMETRAVKKEQVRESELLK